jgi:hypothetical protein
MAITGGKEIALLKKENEHLTSQLAALTLRCEDLVADKKDLRDQVERLQDALVAKESPEAYRDQKYAEEEAKIVDTMTPEEREYERKLAEANRDLLINMESDLFADAKELQETLASQVLNDKLAEIYPETAHGDGES